MAGNLKGDGDREKPCLTAKKVVLKLKYASESPNRLVKTLLAEPDPRVSGAGIGLKNGHI